MENFGTVSSILGAAGNCPEIQDGNKVWKLGHPTQKAKAILVGLITAAAYDSVAAMEGHIPAEGLASLKSEFLRQVTAQHFQTYHPGWVAALASQDGDAFFLQSLLKLNHPEITRDDVVRLFREQHDRVKLAMAQVMLPFFDILELDFPHQLPKEVKDQTIQELRKRY